MIHFWYISTMCISHILRWGSRDQQARAGTDLLIIDILVRSFYLGHHSCFNEKTKLRKDRPIRPVGGSLMMSDKDFRWCDVYCNIQSNPKHGRGWPYPHPCRQFTPPDRVELRVSLKYPKVEESTINQGMITGKSVKGSLLTIYIIGPDHETRTHTPFGTGTWSRRVCQFRHVRIYRQKAMLFGEEHSFATCGRLRNHMRYINPITNADISQSDAAI